MKKFGWILFLFFSSTAFAQQNKSLSDMLAKMVVSDQKAASLPPAGVAFESPQWQNFKDSVFTSHYGRLKEVFVKNGFPGEDVVGKDGSKNFWLMVQHLDKWPDFQQQVLNSMEKQVAKENASAKDFAYLTDRVRLNTGRKQVYGTQVTYNLDSCQAIPRSLENPESVNQRRKSVGLDLLEKYLNGMSGSHFLMNKESYEKRGIHQPKLYPIQK
ncbi:DUF6624 domain-containing protein [Pedobacter sp. Hv1]|uniref:DUF6624 domain-containing protein n=1 Tax=Pedobacter sp. Hv1 TaxID=1740090 RepID=UPI0006D8A752|nr:DUF6624 domain-containing protein [Pedobacter sp. Hv1]KQB99246.1 hypothetical protein AQF98_16865 [Pedobacter sp. Hv1]